MTLIEINMNLVTCNHVYIWFFESITFATGLYHSVNIYNNLNLVLYTIMHHAQENGLPVSKETVVMHHRESKTKIWFYQTS